MTKPGNFMRMLWLVWKNIDDRDVLTTMTNLESYYDSLGIFDQARSPLGRLGTRLWQRSPGYTQCICAARRDVPCSRLVLRRSRSLWTSLWFHSRDSGDEPPKVLAGYELLGIVYGNYAEVQGNLESAEKCYKRGLCSREKHPRMVKISVILECLNKKRPQDDKAAGQPSAETDCEKQPVKDQSDEQISLQLESLNM